jgi:hypothetical protein
MYVPYCCLLLSWESWNSFECVVSGVLICLCFHVVAEYTVFNNCNFSRLSVLFISKFNSIYYSVMVTRCCRYSCFVLLKMGDSDARNM